MPKHRGKLTSVFGVHELAAAALAVLLASGGHLELPEQAARVVVADVGVVPTGANGELSLTLLETPAAGFPLAVRIDDSPLSLRDQRLSWTDVVDPVALQPRLSAPFVAPAQPGRFDVAAAVTYVTCDARRCRTRHARVTWTVQVQAPAATAAEPTGPAAEPSAPSQPPATEPSAPSQPPVAEPPAPTVPSAPSEPGP